MTTHRPANLVVDPAPQDSVSRVSFSPDGKLLLVSTWTGSVSLYDTANGTLRTESRKHIAPVLDATWISSRSVASVALDGSVLSGVVTEGGFKEWNTVGKHSAAASCVVTLPNNLLASGGWDSRFRLWSTSGEKVADLDAGGKVYSAVRCGEHGVLFINSERHVRLTDVRKTDLFLHDKIPPKLSYQLRGLSASEDGTQYVVGSTAGRVAVEWLDGSSDSFSFKCHRLDGLAFPVNCIAHNSKYGSFATGGGDGHVSFWDGDARKRIAQYPRYPTSVSSIDFDNDSSHIAIAVSYTFEEGEKDHPPDEVLIRKLEDAHIVTKTGLGGAQNGTEHANGN